ncbi:MAG: hypothetical protein LBK99_24680 [Opitutaceae bacterium]|nr:hypothetical protein [Opitutaceae bacterium]
MKTSLLPVLTLALMTALLAGGCASPVARLPKVETMAPADIAALTRVTHDAGTSTFTAPRLYTQARGVNVTWYQLEAVLAPGGAPAWRLRVFTQKDDNRGWAFWECATLPDGRIIPLETEKRAVILRGVQEWVRGDLTRADVEAIAGAGGKIILHGSLWRTLGYPVTGEAWEGPPEWSLPTGETIDLIPNAAQGFLLAVDTHGR